jgi:hypothetical protein
MPSNKYSLAGAFALPTHQWAVPGPYIAKKAGITTGEVLWHAKQNCLGLPLRIMDMKKEPLSEVLESNA